MDDEPRGGARSAPNQYSRLLEAKVGGHALWMPQDSRVHGGEVGDCGYIMGGIYWKLFNVYVNPPDGLPRLPIPSIKDIKSARVRNTSVFPSSRSSTVAFEASMPLAIPPSDISVTGRFASADTSLAFLGCSGDAHILNVLSRVETAKLQRYLVQHYPALQRRGEGDVFIVQSAMKASGWVGGVAVRNRSEVSASTLFYVPGVGQFSLGAARSVSSDIGLGAFTCDKTAGPCEWTPETPAVYPVVLGTVRVRRRDRILRALGIETTRTISWDNPTTTMNQASLDAMLTGAEEETSQLRKSSSTSSGPSDEDGESPPSRLDDILDDLLGTYPWIDVAVGDSALLCDFVKQFNADPSPESLTYEWDEETDDEHGVTAYLTKISPLPVASAEKEVPAGTQYPEHRIDEVSEHFCMTCRQFSDPSYAVVQAHHEECSKERSCCCKACGRVFSPSEYRDAEAHVYEHFGEIQDELRRQQHEEQQRMQELQEMAGLQEKDAANDFSSIGQA